MTRSDPKAARHENLSSFICSADLPGISIQPLDLFTPVPFPSASGVTGAKVEANKNSVFFDDVRIHESCLIGAEGDGWKVAMATITGEHGGVSRLPKRALDESRGLERARLGGREEAVGPRNYIAEKFLAQCKSNPSIVKRLKENPHLIDSVVNIYVYAKLERAFSPRNAGGMGGAYGGPQLNVYKKHGGTRFIADMAEVLGPYALTDDSEWVLDDGIFEVGHRCGICLAPGWYPGSAEDSHIAGTGHREIDGTHWRGALVINGRPALLFSRQSRPQRDAQIRH